MNSVLLLLLKDKMKEGPRNKCCKISTGSGKGRVVLEACAARVILEGMVSIADTEKGFQIWK